MEIELKYYVEEPIARERILKDRHLAEIKEKDSDEEINMDAVYYDTAEMDLCRAKIAFRVRRENGKPVATLKWDGREAASAEEGLHVRGELNLPVNEAFMQAPDLSVFKGSDVYERIEEAAGGKALREIMRVECVRRQFMVDTGKSIDAISLDLGRIVAAGRQAPVAELEIELYAGDRDDMIALGRELAAKYNLKPGDKSKFQVGLELMGEESSAR